MVVVPGEGLKTNEIELPYICGVELMRGPLVRELSKIDGISVREANMMVDKATRKFSKRIWILLNYILQHSKFPPRMCIQRSPSLLLEAIRMMRIKCVKMDMYDLTLNIKERYIPKYNRKSVNLLYGVCDRIMLTMKIS